MITFRNLREKRRDKKVTWEEIRREIKVSTEVIAKINKDEYISLKTLEKFAIYFNCDIGDLVAIKKEPTTK